MVLILRFLKAVSTWQTRWLLFGEMQLLEVAWCGHSHSHYLRITSFPSLFMAATFYSYMLITFSTSFSAKLSQGSDLFKSFLSARSKDAWILGWQQLVDLEAFPLLSWRMWACLSSGCRKCLCWPDLLGPRGAILQQQEKCIALALTWESRCAHSDETARWEVFKASTQGSCSSEARPVIRHQVPSPAVCLELTLLSRVFWDKL